MISNFLWFVGEAGHSWDNTVARERSRDGHQQSEHVGIVHQHTVKVSKFHAVGTYQWWQAVHCWCGGGLWVCEAVCCHEQERSFSSGTALQMV